MGIFPPFGNIAKTTMKLFVLLFMILYALSPIDILPEALLGPIGLIDDLVVIIFGLSFLGFDIFKKTRIMKRTVRGIK